MIQKCGQCKGYKQTSVQQMQQKIDFQFAEKLLNNEDNYWSQNEFHNLLNWYFVPNTINPNLEHQLLKKLAKDYGIIFEVWQIQVYMNQHHPKMISVSGIQKQELLQQFIAHAVKIIPPIPTFLGFKFKIKKNVRYTHYGSYELSKQMECTICLDKKTICPKTCCGKFICQVCNVSQKCPFCNQNPIITRGVIDLEVKGFKNWLNMALKVAYQL